MSLLRPSNEPEWLRHLSPFGRNFVRLLRRIEGGGNEPLELVAALLCEASLAGDVCLCLDEAAPATAGAEALPALPGPGVLREALLGSRCVGAPGEQAPLILDDANRLYFYRHWRDESFVARSILDRAQRLEDEVDPALLGRGLDRLFSPQRERADWQRVAAALACLKPFALISGGPGTGKTSIVVKVLALLLEQAEGRGQRMRCLLAAPTGKAAVRLSESIRNMKQGLDLEEELRQAIPDRVQTLHRLLGARPDGSYRFGADNLLPCDLLVLDEASMIDLALMARLLEALPARCRLVLLGDRHQLCSVEAGSVLGDLCALETPDAFSRPMLELLRPLGGLPGEAGEVQEAGFQDVLVLLKKSYRFDDASGIGRASAAINRGQGRDAIEALKNSSDCTFRSFTQTQAMYRALDAVAVEGFGDYLRCRTAEEALDRFSSFMILCALRQGPAGVEAVNERVRGALERAGLIAPRGRWYRGQPLMVTRNLPAFGLFNGDIGLIWPDPREQGALRAFFPTPAGLKSFSPSRIPELATVFAMTVHKSQGSEFDEVLILLPESSSPILSRELIYTALTRARSKARLWGSEAVLREAIARAVQRQSGLADALHRCAPADSAAPPGLHGR